MEVAVRALSGDLLCSFEVLATQTVADLKELIRKSTQIKPNLQKLLLGVKLLSNGEALGSLLTEGQF